MRGAAAPLASDGGRGLKHRDGRIPRPAARRTARQRWRAWIETGRSCCPRCPDPAPLASDGGRGLKRRQAHRRHTVRQAPLASDGGRGLKLFLGRDGGVHLGAPLASDGGRGLKPRGYIRPCNRREAPLASDGGRGLKPVSAGGPLFDGEAPLASDGGRGLKRGARGLLAPGAGRTARQRWRAWIETPTTVTPAAEKTHRSPAMADPRRRTGRRPWLAPLASDGGRGLKRQRR